MKALDLLETLPVMLWTARADGVWTHVNPRWSAYTGLDGHTPGFGFESALHPDDVAATVTRWTEAVQTGRPYRAEYRLRRSDGLYRWHLTHGVRAPQPDHDVVWTGACTDIHDQKLAEHEVLAAREAAVRALGLALEARDQETKGHTDRVTALALRLAQATGLQRDDCDTLRLGAYLHDIGKITVPDHILLKPGRLTPDERLEMQEHVVAGARFSAALGFLAAEVLEVIHSHHERWDGSGYPAGLVGNQIPLLARIFALGDVYDALISERPYKPAWAAQDALAELSAQAGRQFDPDLTRLFVELMTHPQPEGDPPRRPQEQARQTHVLEEHVRARALHEAEVSVLITDAEQRLVYVNPAFSRVTGYEPAEVLGRTPRFLQGPETDLEDKRALREAIAAGRPVHQLILNYSRSGQKLWFEMHLTPLFVQGQLAYFLAVQNDCSDRIVEQQRLEWNATHDSLTGLLNRASLQQPLLTAGPCALVFIDLDNLKGINDRHGHVAGDEALRQVAQALRSRAPAGSQIFRLGGDEFLAVVPVETEAEATRWIDQLRLALTSVETRDGGLTGSFGCALYPSEGQDLWKLMGLADERMYVEKLEHNNRRASTHLRAGDHP
ncbi:HD domain-containing phosphohydrolase [Deinococcus sonorensis]|uniref:HD domain-containing phosphohydrolase n=1 Tax=Deinococcus sonorensis TaxID=309891 RepID=A0ABV8YFQ5_9DEIO